MIKITFNIEALTRAHAVVYFLCVDRCGNLGYCLCGYSKLAGNKAKGGHRIKITIKIIAS